MKKIYYIPILLLTFIIIFNFVPFSNPIKYVTRTTINFFRFSGNLKNFGSDNSEATNQKVAEMKEEFCNYKLKYSTEKLDKSTTDQQAYIGLNLKDNKEKLKPDIQLLCVNLDNSLKVFKENFLKNYEQNSALKDKFQLTQDQLSGMDYSDFYKTYLKNTAINCVTNSNYNLIPFIHNDIINNLEKDYIRCSTSQSENENQEFYFFTKDRKKLVMIKIMNMNLKNDFLAF